MACLNVPVVPCGNRQIVMHLQADVPGERTTKKNFRLRCRVFWKAAITILFAKTNRDPTPDIFLRLGEDEENRPLATKAAMSDDVALMVLLRPWQDAEYPSGVCVVCTQLHDEQTPLGDQVRSLQARGLTRTVEVFNADFHLPIVMCGTMNCLPSSSTYEILCRGVEAQDPAKPLPAGKPLVTPLSTSSVRIRWSPPPDDSEALSPPIDKYWILWVPGGSRFLAGESISIFESECLVYDLVETETGNVRTVQNPLRSFVVTGLSSGVAYEFRISAVNSLGRGPWGERSEPVRTPFLAGNDPEGKVLLSAASIKLLRERELVETRRRTEERVADPRAYELRKLVKVPGLVDLDFEKRHPFHSVSGLTPRYSDATLHPDLANARTDAGFPIIQAVTDVDSIASISTGGRRRRRGRRVKQGSNASVLTRDRDGERSYDTAGCLLEGLDDEPTAEFSPRGHATTTDGDSAGGWTRDTTLPDHCIPPGEERPTAAGEGKNGELQIYRTLTCGDPCSRLACLDVSGARNTRQTHALGLRSAYMTYWAGGEPAFTMLSDNLSGTVDFIFFSEQSLLPGEILSIPEMGDLVERDVRQTELVPNSGSWEPSEWNGDPAEEGFEGEWSPYLRENPKRTRHRIPNDIFPSNHLMLMANLYYSEPHCPSSWR